MIIVLILIVAFLVWCGFPVGYSVLIVIVGALMGTGVRPSNKQKRLRYWEQDSNIEEDFFGND